MMYKALTKDVTTKITHNDKGFDLTFSVPVTTPNDGPQLFAYTLTFEGRQVNWQETDSWKVFMFLASLSEKWFRATKQVCHFITGDTVAEANTLVKEARTRWAA